MVCCFIWRYDGRAFWCIFAFNVDASLVWGNDKWPGMDCVSPCCFCIMDAIQNYLWGNIIRYNYHYATGRTGSWLDDTTTTFIIFALSCYYLRLGSDLQQGVCKISRAIWFDAALYFVQIVFSLKFNIIIVHFLNSFTTMNNFYIMKKRSKINLAIRGMNNEK